MSLVQSIAPSIEPTTAAEFKSHARIDITDDDTLIGDYILPTARRYIEDMLTRQLINATFVLKMPRFPFGSSNVWLPNPPLVSVTSVTYLDTNGDSQTLATSEDTVDASMDPGRIHLQYSKYWPSTQLIQDAVTITFVAGYGATAASVPVSIRHAIYLIAGDLYENRENSIVGQVSEKVATCAENLVFPYVIHTNYPLAQ